MPFDTELLEAMPDTIQWFPFISVDANGNEQYTVTGTNVRANVTISRTRSDPKRNSARRGRNQSDTPPAGQSQIICPDSGIKVKDRIVLPDGNDAWVVSVTNYRDAPDVGGYVQVLNLSEER